MRKALKLGTIIKFTRATAPFKKGQIGIVIGSRRTSDGKTVYNINPTVGAAACVQRNNNMEVLDVASAVQSSPKFSVGDRVTVTRVLYPVLGTRYKRGDSGVVAGRTLGTVDPMYTVTWDKGGQSSVIGEELTKQSTPAPTPKNRLGFEPLSGSRLVTSVVRPDGNIELTLSRPEGAARIVTSLGLTPDAAAAVVKVLQAVL